MIEITIIFQFPVFSSLVISMVYLHSLVDYSNFLCSIISVFVVFEEV